MTVRGEEFVRLLNLGDESTWANAFQPSYAVAWKTYYKLGHATSKEAEKLAFDFLKKMPYKISSWKVKNWEELKFEEGDRKSRLDGVPLTLPALNRAQRLQEKASYAGFDWDDISSVWEKVEEEIQELKQAQLSGDLKSVEEELGDFIFLIVNLSRFLNINSEDALRNASKKFSNRFYKLEQVLLKDGKTFKNTSTDQLNSIWDKVKKEE